MYASLAEHKVQPGDIVEYAMGDVYTVHPNHYLSSPEYNNHIPFHYKHWASGGFKVLSRAEDLKVEDFV